MERIVLDTNCLVSSLRRSSIYYPIWRDFVAGKYCLCFTDDILNEYQEIIEQRTGSVDIFLKWLTPAQAKPYTMKNTAATFSSFANPILASGVYLSL